MADYGGADNIDPSTTKYLIRASINADGVVEKPDVVGAIFGQTEGLLGNELDLRDLQKSGRIGRIEVNVDSKKGRSSGEILLPSSLDKVETAILAAALESIDRVGPCKAEIKVQRIDDVRVTKRQAVIDRAKSLLHTIIETAKDDSGDITEAVRQTVRTEEIVSYGQDRCPAGPNVAKSDAILIVEGRNDVLNLLKIGIKNAIAVEGTNVPKTIQDLTRDKVATAFMDGDRGGELILKELLQTCEVDFIARAPRGQEVEELTQKAIMKALRNKIPAEQYIEMFGIEGVKLAEKSGRKPEIRKEMFADWEREGAAGGELERAREERRGPREGGDEGRFRGERRDDRRDERRGAGGRETAGDAESARFRGDRRDERRGAGGRETGGDADSARFRGERRDDRRDERRDERREREPAFEEPQVVAAAPSGGNGREATFLSLLDELSGKLQAVLLNKDYARQGDLIAVRDLADTLRKETEAVHAVVFDGVITQRLLDIASEKGIATLVGVKTGNITKKPGNVEVVTRAELERA